MLITSHLSKMTSEVPRPPVVVEVPEVLNSSVKTLVAYGALYLGFTLYSTYVYIIVYI